MGKRRVLTAVCVTAGLAVTVLVLALCFREPGRKETGDAAGQRIQGKETGSRDTEGVLKGAVIVLDAGHGGVDPGKIGVGGSLEKDINLKIVLKLRYRLEADGAKIVLTREDEDGLYNVTDKNKKLSDMTKRVGIINNAGADMIVSIHQNSFPKASAAGGQVFYYKTSVKGRAVAVRIQEQLRMLSKGNEREAAANTDYYILKKSDIPAVIVECGFLSNPKEERLLNSEEYREKIVDAIAKGIIRYYEDDCDKAG